MCVVQRKGKCGTESAPKKCLRRILQQQRKAHAATAAAAAKQPVTGEQRSLEVAGEGAAEEAGAAVAGADVGMLADAVL